MTELPARVYRGSTGTERVRQRRAALLEAAFELIAEDGWRALRLNALCTRAGLSKRYFYESFADLDAVTVALIEQLGAGFEQALTHAHLELPLDEFVHSSVDALVHYVTDDPRRARVLFDEVSASPAASRYRTQFIRRMAELITVRGRMLHRRPADVDPVAELAASLLLGGTIQALLDWIDGRVAMTRQQLIDDLTALWRSVGDRAQRQARTRHEGDRGRDLAPGFAQPVEHPAGSEGV